MEVWPVLTETWVSPSKRRKLVSAAEILADLRCTSDSRCVEEDFDLFFISMILRMKSLCSRLITFNVSLSCLWFFFLEVCGKCKTLAGGCWSADLCLGLAERASSCLSQDVGYPVWQQQSGAPASKKEEMVRECRTVCRTGGEGTQGQEICPEVVNSLLSSLPWI